MKTLLVFSILFLTSCAKDFYDSVENIRVSESDAQIIASDFVEKLSKKHPPAKNRLYLSRVDKELGKEFEKILRDKGFGVSTIRPDKDDKKTINIAYIIDQIEPKKVFVRLAASSGYQVSTLYFKDDKKTSVRRISGFTILE